MGRDVEQLAGWVDADNMLWLREHILASPDADALSLTAPRSLLGTRAGAAGVMKWPTWSYKADSYEVHKLGCQYTYEREP